MRGAVRNKKRWKGRRTPTQDPSTDIRLRTRFSQTPTGAFAEGWLEVSPVSSDPGYSLELLLPPLTPPSSTARLLHGHMGATAGALRTALHGRSGPSLPPLAATWQTVGQLDAPPVDISGGPSFSALRYPQVPFVWGKGVLNGH